LSRNSIKIMLTDIVRIDTYFKKNWYTSESDIEICLDIATLRRKSFSKFIVKLINKVSLGEYKYSNAKLSMFYCIVICYCAIAYV
jgi:hypothetical protein